MAYPTYPFPGHIWRLPDPNSNRRRDDGMQGSQAVLVVGRMESLVVGEMVVKSTLVSVALVQRADVPVLDVGIGAG
jgi:hypothetical protein